MAADMMTSPNKGPWLTIVGVQEAGAEALGARARAAIEAADIIFGGPRHLELVGAGARGRPWPMPFSIEPVLETRGQNVVALASGDPFSHGAGRVLSQALTPGEWVSLPAPSTFSLAANALGWPLEETICRALHAAPFETIRDEASTGARLILLMRDGAAVHTLARQLASWQVTAAMTVLERLDGPAERITPYAATEAYQAPVAVALQILAADASSRAAGRPERAYAHDGQITKAPIRALTLAALAPRRDELLWDLGAGSGSISVEWCRLGGRAIAVESQAPRARNIAANIASFGLGARMVLEEGDHQALLATLPHPDAVFVGGGFSETLFALLRKHAKGARLVVNAVTLETESLLVRLAQDEGRLLRVELSEAAPLGTMRGWKATRPVTQWITQL
ncbi:bifunctional cobalt-precorrin-7 (C(5))-methyltransferase/cobalt-precorrin-6B (C(15))-methyltransferase [Paracoccus aminophilus]|uniref:Precorrin-6Y C5,15-methyltransferase/precorrin-8W decarboxylase n=1 Tax=Paracoccus aminophilus JCM 7686 TaxID=1367847 RepID=S5XXW6_PARAH|nr:bifunctional cobalt-precorrin-7 (C(5))-methyltransferase/cobalt-precorrin-6B (C(15))-methyltransferase [Paracoccus aminophilus]AGT08290.1 precorrin-6Y C5,15-methyltransferase/precorrin-8W decarboxylase [Paracoccus aminophilus JCM 7686]